MNEEKKCPRCGEMYSSFPALSRRDDKTDICPTCGQEEALIDVGFLKATENEKSFSQNKTRRQEENTERICSMCGSVYYARNDFMKGDRCSMCQTRREDE
jgi:hypothetical protein